MTPEKRIICECGIDCGPDLSEDAMSKWREAAGSAERLEGKNRKLAEELEAMTAEHRRYVENTRRLEDEAETRIAGLMAALEKCLKYSRAGLVVLDSLLRKRGPYDRH
jgi:hypothetical protein